MNQKGLDEKIDEWLASIPDKVTRVEYLSSIFSFCPVPGSDYQPP
jgi:hypothetical protein